MSIHPTHDGPENQNLVAQANPVYPGETHLLRDMLDIVEFSQEVRTRVAARSVFSRISDTLFLRDPELREAAKLLIERDNRVIGKAHGVVHGATSEAYTQILPLTESDEIAGRAEPAQTILQTMVYHVNACLKEFPACKKEKWFLNHERDLMALVEATRTQQPVTVQIEEIHPS